MTTHKIVDSEFQDSYKKLEIELSSGAITEETFEERYEAIRTRRILEINILLEGRCKL